MKFKYKNFHLNFFFFLEYFDFIANNQLFESLIVGKNVKKFIKRKLFE